MPLGHPPLLRPLFYEGEQPFSVHSWGIKKFVIFTGGSTMFLVLVAFSVLLYKITTSYLNQAYSRNAMFRAIAQAHDISSLLRDVKYDLEYLTRLPMTSEIMRSYLTEIPTEKKNRYRELAFEGKTPEECFVLVNNLRDILLVPFAQALTAKTGILSKLKRVNVKAGDSVSISEPIEAIYPTLSGDETGGALPLHVIRLSKAVYDENNEYQGRLILSLDLAAIRDILSLHNAKNSPFDLHPQGSVFKKSFFFNLSGWLIFQSENPEKKDHELSVDALRTGVKGDVGHPEFHSAFRPSFDNDLYWTMVSDVQNGKSGQLPVRQRFSTPSPLERSHYLSYVPIVFQENETNQHIVGGIGCVDTSFVYMVSAYHLAGTLTICFCIGLVLILCSFYFLGRRISKQLDLLNAALDARVAGDDHSPVTLAPLFLEIGRFQRLVNVLLLQLQIARSDTIIREGLDEDDRMRQKVDLEWEIHSLPGLDPQLLARPFCGIVGACDAVGALKRQILKAAGVLADVLIVGETGTGKELAAEAIHKSSYRAAGPFLSINCGALDENLLLDTLFGHVKGAFSDARDERQGAFLAASGGTLHLDEIGNASAKVQGVLLRALSVRRIRPLGSDKDVPFDARVIAATNADLLRQSLAGEFRSDLYYRLAVITVHTPPLRSRKDDIPVLVSYFMKKHADPSGENDKFLSRGALEKLLGHDWPGNIRELENCITRSLTFAEGDILLAEHILFHTSDAEYALDYTAKGAVGAKAPPPVARKPSAPEEKDADALSERDMSNLNPRQRKVWNFIARQKSVTRSEYQEAVGGNISVRTAQYDLYDLVRRGILKKIGNGPISHYIPIQSSDRTEGNGNAQ